MSKLLSSFSHSFIPNTAKLVKFMLCFSLVECSETEVGGYHFDVWGAAVCCTFHFAGFVKVPHSLSWWARLGRPTNPPFELFKKQKSHADKPFLCSLWFSNT